MISSSVDKYLLSVVLCCGQTVFHKCQTKVEKSFIILTDFSPTAFSVQEILFKIRMPLYFVSISDNAQVQYKENASIRKVYIQSHTETIGFPIFVSLCPVKSIIQQLADGPTVYVGFQEQRICFVSSASQLSLLPCQ